jgi:hypothetical protein
MQPQPDQPTSKRDYTTIAQVAVSGLGLALSLLAAFGAALFGVIGLTDNSGVASVFSLFSTAWIGLLVSALAAPSLVYSIQRLGARAPKLPDVRSFRLANILILIWPLILLLGNILSGQPRVSWLLLPPLQLLAIGIPVLWLVEIARRRLPWSSRQRGWGLVNFSIFITTPTLMFVEILALGVIFVLFAVWVNTQPELVRLLNRLVQRLVNAPSNPEAILEIVRPYLQNPLLIFGILAVVAGLVPLIEELFKPLAVWALAGRRLTPAEGFVAGVLCGAAFGLVESLFYLSNPLPGGWAGLAIGRTGTALLHITTSALIGWALANAWKNGAYLRLGLAYLLAVFLHGLWNALSIMSGLAGTLNNPPAALQPLTSLARVAPVGVAVLALLLFVVLWGSNSYLQRQPGLSPEATLAVQPSAEPAGDAEPIDLSKSS